MRSTEDETRNFYDRVEPYIDLQVACNFDSLDNYVTYVMKNYLSDTCPDCDIVQHMFTYNMYHEGISIRELIGADTIPDFSTISMLLEKYGWNMADLRQSFREQLTGSYADDLLDEDFKMFFDAVSIKIIKECSPLAKYLHKINKSDIL